MCRCRARGPRISARKRALAKQLREEEIRRGSTREEADAGLPRVDGPLIHPGQGLEQLLSECAGIADGAEYGQV